MPAEPVCLACRRPLPSEPDDLALTLDGVLEAVQPALDDPPPPEATDQVARRLAEASLCRACGRPS